MSANPNENRHGSELSDDAETENEPRSDAEVVKFILTGMERDPTRRLRGWAQRTRTQKRHFREAIGILGKILVD